MKMPQFVLPKELDESLSSLSSLEEEEPNIVRSKLRSLSSSSLSSISSSSIPSALYFDDDCDRRRCRRSLGLRVSFDELSNQTAEFEPVPPSEASNVWYTFSELQTFMHWPQMKNSTCATYHNSSHTRRGQFAKSRVYSIIQAAVVCKAIFLAGFFVVLVGYVALTAPPPSQTLSEDASPLIL